MKGEDSKVSCNEVKTQAKKDYKKPEFKVYGDIRTVTKGGANSTNSDSGMNLMSPP